MTLTLPHHETEHQQSIKSIWSCILGNQGLACIIERITELLTAFNAKHTMYHRKNMDLKIINVADCKICKERLLAVECLLLIIYNYPTGKTRILYKSTDGLTGRPVDHQSNSHWLGDVHRAIPKLTVRLN